MRYHGRRVNPWYRDGLRFTCTQCGDCCRSHGEYRWVFLDVDDVKRLAAHHGLPNAQFLGQYCDRDEDGLGHTLKWPDQACVFLKESGCSVYEARPQQCRTWPFWPENLRKETWDNEIVPFCPGAGEGKLFTLAELRRIAKGEDHSSGA